MLPDSARLLAFLLNAAVQVGLTAAGTTVALRVTRTARAGVKCRIAVIGLICCAVVPVVSAWPGTGVNGIATVITPPVDTSALSGGRIATVVASGYVVLLLWKIVTLIQAAMTTIAIGRSSTPIVDGPIFAAFQRSGALRHGIRLFHSPRAATPLVCGVRRPAIVFPDDFASSDAGLIDGVIAHECAHITRHDVAAGIAIEVLTAPLAMHPAIGALKRAAARYREIACDELAVARLKMPRPAYASLLLRVAEWRTNDAASLAAGAAAHLEARVRDLLEPQRSGRMSLAAWVLVCVCLFAPAAAAPLAIIANDGGWAQLSGVWTLDVDQSQPRDRLPFRAARLRINATRDRVDIAQERLRRDNVEERFEIRRLTDNVPSDLTLPGGMVVQTRARWDGSRLIANSSTPGDKWREHVEATASGNRLVIQTENVTDGGFRHYAFVFRRQ